MEKKVLVVVDMLNGFVNEGALADKSIHRIVPAIKQKLEKAKENGDTIIFFKDSHSMSDPEFKNYPPHCLKGSKESEIIEELAPYAKDAIVIEKNTTNGFITPEFQSFLAENGGFDEIEVTGCESDICVYDFTSDLLKYKKEKGLDWVVKVEENSIDTFHGASHDPDYINKVSLARLEMQGAEVVRNYDENGIRITKCKRLTDERFLNLYYLEYETPNGTIKYTVASRQKIAKCVAPTLNPDAVTVLPYSLINGETVVYVTKEFRYPIGDFIYSLPSGIIDEGETSEMAAIREAKEETGAEVLKIKKISSSSYSSAGMTDESTESFEAEVKMGGESDLGEGEIINVIPVKLCDLPALLDNPEFKWENRAKLQLLGFVDKKKSEQIIAEKDEEIAQLKAKLEELEKE